MSSQDKPGCCPHTALYILDKADGKDVVVPQVNTRTDQYAIACNQSLILRTGILVVLSVKEFHASQEK